jgi:peptidoglycan/LPS O-acetylase OafA/YrhL
VTETSLPTSAPADYSKHRYLLLDGMRGLAALGVLSFHVVVDSYYEQLDSLYLLVDFFFVLSGFVLFPSMPSTTKRMGKSVGVFVLKRVFRFWPLVIAALLVSLAIIEIEVAYLRRNGGFDVPYGSFLGKGSNAYWEATIAAFLLLQIVVSAAISINAPLWSLSAEWFANVIAAPLTAIKWGLGIIAVIVVGYVMLAYGLSTDQKWIKDVGPIRGWEALGRAMLGFGLGLLLRKYLPQLSRWRTWWMLLISIAGLVVLYYLPQNIGYAACYVAAPIFALFILQLTKYRVSATSILGRFLAFLGAYSFGIYVFHFPLTQLYTTLFGGCEGRCGSIRAAAVEHFLTEAVVVSFFAILLTFVAHWVLEKPLQKLGSRLVARASR